MEEQLRYKCVVNIENIGQDDAQASVSEATRAKENKIGCAKQLLLKCFDNNKLSSKEVRRRESTPIEKIIWSFMFTLCLLYCGCLIWKSYIKWSKSPAIVMLSENNQPVWQIPFPAVTICPTRKVKSQVFSLERYLTHRYVYDNVTENEEIMFEDISLICDTYNHFLEVGERRFSIGNDTVHNIKKVSTNLSEVMLRCYWKGKTEPCDKIFTPILTDEGVCFTFNTIGPEDMFWSDNLNKDYEYMENLNRTRVQNWTPEDGYSHYISTKSYPMRSTGANVKAGLKVILTEMEEILDLGCMDMVTGFKILLHHPSALPRLSQDYIRVPLNEEVTVVFAPKLQVTSEGLRQFSPTGRQCYFAYERRLKFFNLYTQSNCQIECLTNFTYARCDCVPFSMPHGPDMKICSAGSFNCTLNAEMELSAVEIGYKLEKGVGNDTTEEALEIANNCQCLPGCTSITYHTEMSQLKLQKRQQYIIEHVMKNKRRDKTRPSDPKASVLVVFFKSSLYDISKRAELYGATDIIADCGGILGLFMGFSVINIIKSLYVCFLRVCCQRRGHDTKRVHSEEQVVQNSEEKY